MGELHLDFTPPRPQLDSENRIVILLTARNGDDRPWTGRIDLASDLAVEKKAHKIAETCGANETDVLTALRRLQANVIAEIRQTEEAAAAAQATPATGDSDVHFPTNGWPSADHASTLTDVGNARRFVAQHGLKFRHCFPWRKFLTWDGKRWTIDNAGNVETCAKKTALSIYAEAARATDQAAANKIAAHAKASQSVSRINAMIALARSEPGIPMLPAELDADPWLLNVSNGTIDLHTGELRPHRREDLITKLAPVEYGGTPIRYEPKEACCCRAWIDFLERIMAGNVDLIGFLQRAIGYALTGDVSEQVLFFFYGTGANGKSTLLNVLIELLGDYAAQLNADVLMVKQGEAHPTALTDLYGRRLASCVEVEEAKRFAEVLVKQLTGGDHIRARRMKEDFWEFAPTHKVFLAANHKPNIRGTDHAIWRRIKLVPFTVTIPDDQQDKQLPTKLRREYPAILRWTVEGCLAWQKNGLGEPDEVRTATAEYRGEMDSIASFMRECCVVLPDARVRAKDLFDTYSNWSGDRHMTQREFGRRLQERGFSPPEKGTGGYFLWRGIGLPHPGEPVE